MEVEEKKKDVVKSKITAIDVGQLPINALKKRYLTLNRKLYRSTLCSIPHEFLPGFNCSVDHSFDELPSYPQCNVGYPRPAFISPCRPNDIDHCHLRTRALYSYNSSLRRYHSYFNYHKRKKNFKALMKKKEKIYPSLIFRFAELLELNPDPYFTGMYDWYYTGGNLDVVENQNIVLHVVGDNLGTLVISKISKDDQKVRPKLIKVSEDGDKNPEIFEIQAIQSTTTTTYFSVRKKHDISVYTYDKCNLACQFSLTEENVPYISSASHPQDLNSFVTSDLEKRVLLWDINKSTVVPKQVLFDDNSSEKNKNWNCVRYFDRNLFAFTGLQEFKLLDKRIPFEKSMHKFGNFNNAFELCENISSMCVSAYENLVYMGTTHKMFAVDVRYLGNQIEDKSIVIRWTHQMNMSPHILRTYPRENYELIAVTSPISGDIRLCENLNDIEHKSKFISPCLPYMPPSLLDAYTKAQFRGKCLDPTAYLKSRIGFCTTGMKLFKQNDNFFMLWSNSNADVFSQKITFSNEYVPPCEIENASVMEKWEKDSIKAIKKSNLSLNVTEMGDLSGLSKVFRCNLLDYHKVDKIYEPKRPHRLQKWQQPIHNLHNYKDALATDILAAWDIDDDKTGIGNIDLEQYKQSNPVEEWLGQTTEPDPPMVRLLDTSFTETTENNMNLFGPNSPRKSDFNDTFMSLENEAFISSKTKTRSTRKSRYVQGF